MNKQKKTNQLKFFLISLLFLFKFLQEGEALSQVYVTGLNAEGQLGLTIPGSFGLSTFTENPILEEAIEVIAGSEHGLALFKNGTVASFGQNKYGQLGLGDLVDRSTPTIIPNLNNVKSVYAGDSFSMVILNDGSVYFFGENSDGQMGIGNGLSSILSPLLNPILNGNEIQKVSLYSHTLILLNNGSVLAIGYNNNGELCQGNYNNFNTPTLIPNLDKVNILDLVAIYQNSLFLLNNGSILICGANSYGQLGLGPNIQYQLSPALIPSLSNVVKLNCGRDFCYAILFNGSIFSWGDNSDGQLGLTSTANNQSLPTLIPGINNAIEASLGYNYGFILLENGTIMGIGSNSYGQLGLGDALDRHFFVEIPILDSLTNLDFTRTKFIGFSVFFMQYVPDNVQTSKGINLAAAVVTPIVLLIFISVSFILLFLYIKRRNFRNITDLSTIQLRESIKEVQINENELIGGSNRIYKGNYTGKNVALKKIINNNTNEYTFYVKIERNPSIVEYFGIYEYKGERYIILELLNSSLDKYLKSTKNLPIEKLTKFMARSGICLLYLEDKGYIHGNICCENILRKENDQLKLCDFEFTHTLENPLTLSENDFSKVKFCAPEVKKKRKYDKKSDVWSWSVTCIQIFYLNQQNNEEPFQMNEQILNLKPPQCSDALWNLIQRGLAPDPSLRPSFKEIVDFFPKETRSYTLIQGNRERESTYSHIRDQQNEEAYVALQKGNDEEYTIIQNDKENYDLTQTAVQMNETDGNYSVIP